MRNTVMPYIHLNQNNPKKKLMNIIVKNVTPSFKMQANYEDIERKTIDERCHNCGPSDPLKNASHLFICDLQ